MSDLNVSFRLFCFLFHTADQTKNTQNIMEFTPYSRQHVRLPWFWKRCVSIKAQCFSVIRILFPSSFHLNTYVRNEDVLLRVNEQRNILHEIRKRKANWIGYILRRNCLLKQVIEGKIKGEMEVTRIRGWRRKKLLDDLKDRTGYSHLKEEALDRTIWRNRFGGGFGPVVRQNTEWMDVR